MNRLRQVTRQMLVYLNTPSFDLTIFYKSTIFRTSAFKASLLKYHVRCVFLSFGFSLDFPLRKKLLHSWYNEMWDNFTEKLRGEFTKNYFLPNSVLLYHSYSFLITEIQNFVCSDFNFLNFDLFSLVFRGVNLK